MPSIEPQGEPIFRKEMMAVEVYVNGHGRICIDQTDRDSPDAVIVELAPEQVGTVIQWLEQALDAARKG